MARKSGIQYFKYVAIFVMCLVAACYMVPEYPDYPQSDRSMVDEMKLDGTGDKLLVRTKQYDYDFALSSSATTRTIARPISACRTTKSRGWSNTALRGSEPTTAMRSAPRGPPTSSATGTIAAASAPMPVRIS